MCKKIDPTQKSTIGTIRTKEENSKILTTFPGATWIGGFELGSTGQFFWWGSYETSKKITTTFWRTGEPSRGDRGSHEGCIMYNYHSSTSWDDDMCPKHYMGLCEIRCD